MSATNSKAGEPLVTGAITLTRVSLSSLTLMKIVQHGTRSLPELCAGSLLGLDDGKGGLEVSDCFAFPVVSGGPSTNPHGNANGADDEVS